MKVLHVGEYVQGGVATYISMFLNHPNHTEIKDYIICSGRNSEHKWSLPKGRVHYYTYHRSIFQVLPAMITVWKEIRRLKPDAIYCHSTWAGLFARFPMLFLGKPCRVIYNAHGWAFLRNTAEWKRKVYAEIEKMLLHSTDTVVNVSKHEYNSAIKYGLPSPKLRVIYSGISAEKGAIDPSVKMPSPCVNLLFVGRFDPQKGIDYLLQEFSKCHRNALHLTVIGDNVIGGTHIEKKNSDKVTFLGWVAHEKLASYYSQCDAVVMPSRWEAFDLVAIEAMKYGKPVIVSDKGALPEIVKDGENGLVFDFNDSKSLQSVLGKLSKDKLHGMGNKAEKDFMEHYRLENMVTATIKNYL